MCIRNAACGLNHSVRLELHAERDRERCSKRGGGGGGLEGGRRGFCALREREGENEGEREAYSQILYVLSFCICMRMHSQIHAWV
jgi:hypothetical protein